MTQPPPTGYVELRSGGARGASLDALAPVISAVLDSGTIYAHAGRRPERRVLDGRGPAYAIMLGGVPVVVRHVRHGGLLSRLTGDVFLAPTRAPYELGVSLKLRAAGVATPEVLAYAVYRVGPVLRRADVITREIIGGSDLASCLAPDAPTTVNRRAVWEATTELIAALGRAGAFHADLNVKNILITGADTARPVAHALDVDRVVWRRPDDPTVVRDNAARLHRSAEKRGLL